MAECHIQSYHNSLLILYDFKVNFSTSKPASELDAIHARTASRLHHVCVTNAGLFIKLGQTIGIQATVLPKAYRDAFANIFDAAPVVPYSEVVKVFKEEFGGRTPHEIFEYFEERPMASASIAQVHRARLRVGKGENGENGELREVAVKVQKPAIAKQIELDMWSYR